MGVSFLSIGLRGVKVRTTVPFENNVRDYPFIPFLSFYHNHNHDHYYFYFILFYFIQLWKGLLSNLGEKLERRVIENIPVVLPGLGLGLATYTWGKAEHERIARSHWD